MGSPTTWKPSYYQGKRLYRKPEDISTWTRKGQYKFIKPITKPGRRTIVPPPKRAPIKKKTIVKHRDQTTLTQYWSFFKV